MANAPPSNRSDSKEKPQRQRFIETAKEFGCDENEAEFMRKLGKIVKAKPKDEPGKPG